MTAHEMLLKALARDAARAETLRCATIDLMPAIKIAVEAAKDFDPAKAGDVTIGWYDELMMVNEDGVVIPLHGLDDFSDASWLIERCIKLGARFLRTSDWTELRRRTFILTTKPEGVYEWSGNLRIHLFLDLESRGCKVVGTGETKEVTEFVCTDH